MRKNYLLYLLCILLMTSCQQKNAEDTYIDHLLSQMTLEEKIGQMNLLFWNEKEMTDSALIEMANKGSLGGLLVVYGAEKIHHIQQIFVEHSRLGIPLIIGADVIHGHETIFPIPLAMACSWDTAAIKQAARIAAIEASADGVNWTYSPMVDISHDARWGRISEGAGEDPFLGAQIAKVMVKGYQQDLSDSTDIMACVKHFAFYGAPDGGRDYNTVDMSRNRMYNYYLEPYKAAIEAGAGTVMTSYNTVDGIPSSGNKWLLTDLLRHQLGFKGMVVSDANAISCMINHGIGTLAEDAIQALKAGTEMDMNAKGYIETLAQSVKEGKVSEQEIDKACRHILEVKYRLGLLQNPYRYCDTTRLKKDIYTDEHRAFARTIADKSMVLLKNDHQILPLKKEGTIAIIGPLANTQLATGRGSWTSGFRHKPEIKTLYAGLCDELEGKAKVLYAKGCNLYGDSLINAHVGNIPAYDQRPADVMINEALSVARQANVIIAALGENASMCGEGYCRTELNMPETQHRLLEQLLSLGKPVVLVHFSGRPTILKWESEHVPAILQAWFGGTEEAHAIGGILFGDVNPSGKLTVSFPQNGGQIPYFYNCQRTGDPFEKDWYTEYQGLLSNYFDIPNEPLYPFGYGLSYTTYQYNDMQLSTSTMTATDCVKASIKVTNTGDCDGDEIVQLYIRDLYASISRPLKELKGFRRIHLRAGESQIVTFDITDNLLKFYNPDLKYVSEPGDFEIMIGPNSADVETKTLTLK